MVMVIDVISDRRQHRCACSRPGYRQQCSANHKRVSTALTPTTVHVYGRTERKRIGQRNFHCIGTPQSLLLVASLHRFRIGHCAHPLLPHQATLAQLFSRLVPIGSGAATVFTPFLSQRNALAQLFSRLASTGSGAAICAFPYRISPPWHSSSTASHPSVQERPLCSPPLLPHQDALTRVFSPLPAGSGAATALTPSCHSRMPRHSSLVSSHPPVQERHRRSPPLLPHQDDLAQLFSRLAPIGSGAAPAPLLPQPDALALVFNILSPTGLGAAPALTPFLSQPDALALVFNIPLPTGSGAATCAHPLLPQPDALVQVSSLLSPTGLGAAPALTPFLSQPDALAQLFSRLAPIGSGAAPAPLLPQPDALAPVFSTSLPLIQERHLPPSCRSRMPRRSSLVASHPPVQERPSAPSPTASGRPDTGFRPPLTHRFRIGTGAHLPPTASGHPGTAL
ncbi:MAG: hypothetical protein KatS3mg056_2300 [Chloroflexus sp.]|nr:MAG: hypothetical protein KatS3mg056_2300 [Chloroflexus sp.]